MHLIGLNCVKIPNFGRYYVKSIRIIRKKSIAYMNKNGTHNILDLYIISEGFHISWEDCFPNVAAPCLKIKKSFRLTSILGNVRSRFIPLSGAGLRPLQRKPLLTNMSNYEHILSSSFHISKLYILLNDSEPYFTLIWCKLRVYSSNVDM